MTLIVYFKMFDVNKDNKICTKDLEKIMEELNYVSGITAEQKSFVLKRIIKEAGQGKDYINFTGKVNV